MAHGTAEIDSGRRIGPRRSFATDVCLFDESGEPVVLAAADLGPGGMFITSEILYEPGEELWVSFRLPTGPKFVVRGRIIRGQLGNDELPSGMAIAFTDLTEREQGYLGGFVEQETVEEPSWSSFACLSTGASSGPGDQILF